MHNLVFYLVLIMNKLLCWLFVSVVIVIIYILSDIPNLHLVNEASIPQWYKAYITAYTLKLGQSGFFSYTLSIDPEFIVHKLGHIGAFGVLGVCVYFAVGQFIFRAVLVTALLACLDEFHQYFVLGRCCRFGDVVLDTAAGLLFILVVRRVVKKRCIIG